MLMTTQAVVLARGLGTRMRRQDGTPLDTTQRAAADAGAKAMMPLGTGADARPFLDYVLSGLADAGIRDVTLVVAPEHEAVREYYTRRVSPTRLAVRFAVQPEPRGTADGVLAARTVVRDAPFLVLNSDNYYGPPAVRAASGIYENGLVAFEANTLIRESGIDAERVLQFALLDIDSDDVLRGIREKPAPDDPLAQAAERWVSMNLWSFTPAIFEACVRVRPSPRGELELQDAVTIAMCDFGVTFRVVRVRDAVLDLSRRADVNLVATRLAGIVPRT
jgi:dTDP-glucose pyrophosphorylase